MINQEDTSRGYYNPNFFSIYIDGEFDSDFTKMNFKDLGTFAHEYLHFLQNITTVYGLRQGIFFYQFMIEVKKFISNSHQIKVPLTLDFLSSRIKEGKQIFDLLEGTKTSKNVVFEKYEVEIVNRKLFKKQYSIVEIIFSNVGQKSENISFGSLCVKESMARIFQLKFDRDAQALNVPYGTAELLVNKLKPNLINKTNKIFTYLLISLFHNNPGLEFYHLILHSDEDISLNCFEIYKKHVSEFTVNPEGGRNQTIAEYYKDTLYEFKTLLNFNIAGNSDHFLKLIENIEYSFADSRNPILEIFVNEETEKCEKLKILIDLFGIPSIRSKNGYLNFQMDIISQEPVIEFLDFMVQQTVVERLFESREYPKICSMFQICNQKDDLIDDFCFEYQWKRTKACPFKVISDSLGLNEKIKKD